MKKSSIGAYILWAIINLLALAFIGAIAFIVIQFLFSVITINNDTDAIFVVLMATIIGTPIGGITFIGLRTFLVNEVIRLAE